MGPHLLRDDERVEKKGHWKIECGKLGYSEKAKIIMNFSRPEPSSLHSMFFLWGPMVTCSVELGIGLSKRLYNQLKGHLREP